MSKAKKERVTVTLMLKSSGDVTLGQLTKLEEVLRREGFSPLLIDSGRGDEDVDTWTEDGWTRSVNISKPDGPSALQGVGWGDVWPQRGRQLKCDGLLYRVGEVHPHPLNNGLFVAQLYLLAGQGEG